MKNIAIVYWSGTGNTEKMATLIAEGMKSAGAEVTLYTAGDFSADKVGDYDKMAFGCPSMGAEVLEETEFEPMFTAVESLSKGKTIALFGSYGWGDGEWMRDWQERCTLAGAEVYSGEGLIVNETPEGEAVELCKRFGSDFAGT